MSYRNITVNGKNYQYVVGKTHVKVRDVATWRKEEVGQNLTIIERCECCGEPLATLYSEHIDRVALAVTPKNISAKIQEHLKG